LGGQPLRLVSTHHRAGCGRRAWSRRAVAAPRSRRLRTRQTLDV